MSPGDRGGRMDQVELAREVSLTGADGRLNPAAVGWARRPIFDTSGIVKGPHRTWGRAKRWEYWNVISPTHILALTVSSIDYAAVHEVWIFERASGSTWTRAVTLLPARDVDLPANLNAGPARARAKDLEIDLDPLPDGGTRLRATIPEASFDVAVTRPADYDCVAVVVPWSKTRFQYTVKDVALSASGVVTTAGAEHEVPAGSWEVLDHGRGRWPYDVTWNWGAGSGQVPRTTCRGMTSPTGAACGTSPAAEPSLSTASSDGPRTSTTAGDWPVPRPHIGEVRVLVMASFLVYPRSVRGPQQPAGHRARPGGRRLPSRGRGRHLARRSCSSAEQGRRRWCSCRRRSRPWTEGCAVAAPEGAPSSCRRPHRALPRRGTRLRR